MRNHPIAEDIHHFVELSLVERIGSLGLKLHTGRSRNEQIATDLRLHVREQIGIVTGALAAWADALLDRPERAGDAVMPSYTHLQRAEPVLVAHWMLAYVEMILRDAERLKDCAARLNYCPLGREPSPEPRWRWIAPLRRGNLGSTARRPIQWTPRATATSSWSICRRSRLLAYI